MQRGAEMKKRLDKKTRSEKIMYMLRWVLGAILLLLAAYRIYLYAATGQHAPRPLIVSLLGVLFGIFCIIRVRNNHQDSDEERRKFNKIVIRSILLAILIVFCVIVATVLYAISRN